MLEIELKYNLHTELFLINSSPWRLTPILLLDTQLSTRLHFNAHILNKYCLLSAMCHLAAMQPCSMVALLLVVQIITIFIINTVSSCGLGPEPDNTGTCNIHTRAECTDVCKRDFNGAGTCCEGTEGRGAWTKYCKEGECIRNFGS